MVESVGKENVNVRPERILVLSTVESLALFPFSCTLPLVHCHFANAFGPHLSFIVVVIISSILKKERLL